MLALWEPQTLWQGAGSAALFGAIGIVLLLFGFKAFDWITPRIDIQKELAEHHNIAVAIVIAAVIIGASLIIARAVGA